MITQAEDGGVDYDQVLGSILERWLTTRVKGRCRFCRQLLPNPTVHIKDQFCDEKCRGNWQKVMEARLVIGKRDFKQRGYD